MVSIEVQTAYWLPLRINPLTNFFLDFLEGKTGLEMPQLNQSDSASLACNLLSYVRLSDKKAATELYQKLTSRQIRPDSEWIHNDYLIFTLICTVQKFQLESTWVRQIIQQRPNSEHEKRLINKTFENLLAGNINSKEDYHQISVIYQIITHQEQFDVLRLHKMFSYLWQTPFPYFESEFLNIVSLRAIRAAFEAKGLLNPEQRFVSEKFAINFLARTTKISQFLTWLFFATAIFSLIIFSTFYAEQIWIKRLLQVLATLGLGASAVADVRRWLVQQIEQSLRRFLGYDHPIP